VRGGAVSPSPPTQPLGSTAPGWGTRGGRWSRLGCESWGLACARFARVHPRRNDEPCSGTNEVDHGSTVAAAISPVRLRGRAHLFESVPLVVKHTSAGAPLSCPSPEYPPWKSSGLTWKLAHATTHDSRLPTSTRTSDGARRASCYSGRTILPLVARAGDQQVACFTRVHPRRVGELSSSTHEVDSGNPLAAAMRPVRLVAGRILSG
jgi:hypothetical protein